MIRKKDPSIIQAYLEDASNLSGGYTDEVVIPESRSEVCSFLKEATERRQTVTISGGGTGTSGGRIPFGGIILSTEKLTAINDITTTSSGGTVRAEGGVRIQDLKQAIASRGLFYAYDPTEQTACVGGTIATNASGARSFKFGPTRGSVEALSVALSDGSYVSIRRGEITEKNNELCFETERTRYTIPVPRYRMPETKSSAGYYAKRGMDLIDLFIGQEGTLCCVLEATLRLIRKPANILSCFAFFKGEEDAYNFAIHVRDLSLRKRGGGAGALSAMSIEYFDEHTLKLLRHRYGSVPQGRKAAIFFEQDTSPVDEDKVLDEWLEALSRYGVSDEDTWVALTEKNRQDLIDKRHAIPEGLNDLFRRYHMPKVTTDIAVPHARFPEMMGFYKKLLAGQPMPYFLFGHIGDSHLHMDIIPRTQDELAAGKKIALEFIRKSVSFGGTVSAEHGIGKMRREYLKVLYGDEGIGQMKRVKEALDPHWILGRGTMFE
ncbi:MAG: FAD-binding oxidoreductase [Candidatus Omnitrophica bacterium]|nr:FAD-binding oxidoreductase [Candidatus Omnitrophota bacterium]